MIKHTPGPWEVSPTDDTEVRKLPPDKDIPRLVIEQTVRSPLSGEAQANALLIAAAPELLQMVEALLNHFRIPPPPHGIMEDLFHEISRKLIASGYLLCLRAKGIPK